jgi:hypothetical protein
MAETIYMPLVGEGTEVWRPVAASRLAEHVYVILGAMPDDETWAFPPGSRVRCETRRFGAGPQELVAVSLAS